MENSGLNGFVATVKPQSREITEIAVRPPTVRDLKALEQVRGSAARAAKMIERLTGLTAREVGDLHADDMKGLGEIAADFFAVWKKSGASWACS